MINPLLEFVNADGAVTSTFQVDDYSNAADAGNFSTTVAYLTIVSYQFKGGGNSHGP